MPARDEEGRTTSRRVDGKGCARARGAGVDDAREGSRAIRSGRQRRGELVDSADEGTCRDSEVQRSERESEDTKRASGTPDRQEREM